MHIRRGIVCLMLVGAFAGCATSVATIQDDPQRFDGRSVVIRGTVERSVPVPFTEYELFVLADESGHVVVISAEDRSRGDELVLRGTVAAFPEDETSDAASGAVEAIAAFLVDHGLASDDKAADAAAAVMKVVRTVASALGQLFVVIEG
jgi:hypothetical protein